MGPDATSLESDICIHISLPSWTCLPLPPYHPSRPSRSSGLSSLLHSSFPLAILLSTGGVHVSMLLSQFVPPAPFPAVSTSPCPNWMFISPLLKPPYEYAGSLSLKLPQFCYLGRHYLRRDPQCSPYLLQVINPSFSGVKKRILPWSASQMSLNEELKSWFHGFLMTLTTYAEEILNFAWGNLWGKAEWCMLRRKCNFQWRNNAILQHTQTSRFI